MLTAQYDSAEFDTTALLSTIAHGERIAIHAGHVILLWDEVAGRAVPSLPGEAVQSQSVAHAFTAAASFTSDTWELGRALHAAAVDRGSEVAHVILVNDWQFMPAGPARERARLSFYERFAGCRPELFSPSDWTIVHELNGNDTIRRSPFISEKSLRNAYSRRHRRLRSRECHVFTPSEIQPHSQPGCAEEVVELLTLLSASGFTAFINLYPLPCRAHVLGGSEEFAQSGQGSLKTIINVGIPVVGDAPNRASTVAVHEVAGNPSA